MKWLPVVIMVLTAWSGWAQKVTTDKESRKIRGVEAEGHVTELAAPAESVSDAFSRYLRAIGKPRSSSGTTTVTSPTLGGTTWEKMTIYGESKGDLNKTKVWIGLVPAEWEGRDTEPMLAQIKDLVYQFGIKYYRDQIQIQIDETQGAMDATDRKLLKLSSQGTDLAGKLTANEQEKVRLEKALELNAASHILLVQKIEANKKAQDSLTNAAAQIRKVLDGQKDRQQKVN